jgi:UDP-2,3-diacylglucosamine pyrophosphatase LpxH
MIIILLNHLSQVMKISIVPDTELPGLNRPPLREVDIHIDSEESEVVIISDLHAGEGYLQNRRAYARGENFFEDEAFRNFLHHLEDDAAQQEQRAQGAAAQKRPIKLVINGDFLDFIRARSTPTDRERQVYSRYFRRLGLIKKEEDFEIAPHEGKYGLRTEEHKSVWKLRRIAEGHPVLFEALAEFVAHGHKLVLIKGNHDLEFYWPAVQKEFIKLLASKLPSYNGHYESAAERFAYLQVHIEFCQRAYIIEEQIYIEHGHQYQPMTRADETPMSGRELSLPPGSIFNRYLVNSLERIVPFISNIRPYIDIVRLLANSDRLRALRIMMHYLPVAVRMLAKRHPRFSFALLLDVFPYLFGLFYAFFGIFLPAVWKAYGRGLVAIGGAPARFLIDNWFLNLALCFALYFFFTLIGRLINKSLDFKLDEAMRMAKRRMKHVDGKARFIVLGHTHRANIEPLGDNWWYINSGTWTPIIDRQQSMLYERTTLSYAKFLRRENGFDFDLRVWKDQKGKSERMLILE